jgi:hypothetical protein
MTHLERANRRVFHFERGVRPRSPGWGEVRKGAEPASELPSHQMETPP